MFTINDIGKFVFILGVFAYWTGAFCILYHLIRFGVSGQPKQIAVVFLGGSLVLSLITALLFFQVDFSALMNLGNIDLFKF